MTRTENIKVVHFRQIDTLVVTSKWRQSSSSCFFKSWDNLDMVERIPTMELSSCLQKLSLNPLSTSTKQKNVSASTWACRNYNQTKTNFLSTSANRKAKSQLKLKKEKTPLTRYHTNWTRYLQRPLPVWSKIFIIYFLAFI